MATLKSQILEAIVTHPEETVKISDITDQLPKNINIHSVRVCVSRDLRNLGYVKVLQSGAGRTDGAVYKILKRTIDDKVPVRVVKKKTDVSYQDLGKAVFMRVKELEKKVLDLSQGYSDIQSELKKEQEANRLDVRSRQKRNNELLEENKKLRETIKKLANQRGSTFKLAELMGQ